MTRRLTRRDLLRLSGLALPPLLHPPLLLGCSSEDSKARSRGGNVGRSDAGTGGTDSGLSELPAFDPDKPWWLQQNYGPVPNERQEMDLEVEGSLPPELDGLYVRNGSNQKVGEPVHWFLGDGMLHGVRIRNGKALWYRNRYIQTPLLGVDPAGGLRAPTLQDHASNVSVFEHAGRLLTSGEVGLPYEIDPDTLGTLGVFDYAGKLTTAMTAHPKIDAVTGEMLMFGYGLLEPPFLTYHRVDKSGILVQSEPIEMDEGSMMHDFQITESHVIFMDLPIVFDLDLVAAGEFPFRWSDTHPARFGVMPREGKGSDVQWFEIERAFIFHTLNAYDDPDREGVIILEAARHPKLWVDGPNNFNAHPSLHRYEIDLNAGMVREAPIDDRIMEFPQLDRRLVGRKHRYGYGLWLDQPRGTAPGSTRGVLKYDRQAGVVTAHELPLELQADEAYFVPASDGAGEDEGYLMTYVYDYSRDRSDLVLLDASALESAPIARVKLPFRVPFGFHGVWVPRA